METFWHRWRDPLSAVAIWLLLAVVMFSLRVYSAASLLIFLPSGVTVAALHAIPRERWPNFFAILCPLQAITLVLFGLPLIEACAFSLGSALQAIVCVRMHWIALGGRRVPPKTYRHVIGMFGAAFAGGLIGTMLSTPFLGDPSLEDVLQWFLSNVLGILVGAPLTLFLRQSAGIGPIILNMRFDRWFLPLHLVMAGLVYLCLGRNLPHLLPLLTGALVFTTARYREPAPAFAVLIYGIVAIGLSLGGSSVAAFIDPHPQHAILIVQCWFLIMLATALPLAALLMKHRALEEELRMRAEELAQSLTIFRLAEDLAGIGRWRYDIVSGMQDWSPRMLELNGLSPDLAPDPGDVRYALPDGGKELFGLIAAKRDERKPFSFDYRIKPAEGTERILRMSMLNQFDDKGRRIGLFAVAMDVTQQVRREQALDLARGRAVRLAAEAQKLANTDTLTGLPNRRFTLLRLKQMVINARLNSGHLAVVIFDIDNFKRVNDGFGHLVGDEVLMRVADLARGQVRSNDMVGRIGGEEFVWLLPGVDCEAAAGLAERLRSTIENGSASEDLPRVTASVGIATLRAGDTAEAILARADMALYQAKEGGRNRVRLAA